MERKIHKALQRLFSVRSFSDLSSVEFEKIAGIVRMYFCREHGFMIPEANEKGFDPNVLTMREFLKKKQ